MNLRMNWEYLLNPLWYIVLCSRRLGYVLDFTHVLPLLMVMVVKAIHGDGKITMGLYSSASTKIDNVGEK